MCLEPLFLIWLSLSIYLKYLAMFIEVLQKDELRNLEGILRSGGWGFP